MVLLVLLLKALAMITMMSFNIVGSVPSPPTSTTPPGPSCIAELLEVLELLEGTTTIGLTLTWSPLSTTVTTVRRLSATPWVSNITGFEAAVVADLANLTSVRLSVADMA